MPRQFHSLVQALSRTPEIAGTQYPSTMSWECVRIYNYYKIDNQKEPFDQAFTKEKDDGPESAIRSEGPRQRRSDPEADRSSPEAPSSPMDPLRRAELEQHEAGDDDAPPIGLADESNRQTGRRLIGRFHPSPLGSDQLVRPERIIDPAAQTIGRLFFSTFPRAREHGLGPSASATLGARSRDLGHLRPGWSHCVGLVVGSLALAACDFAHRQLTAGTRGPQPRPGLSVSVSALLAATPAPPRCCNSEVAHRGPVPAVSLAW